MQNAHATQRHRDRGESRDSSPPTPPDIRVRIRRFAGLSAGDVSRRRRRAQIAESAVSASVPSSGAVRASPFPAAPKASCLEFGRMADSRSPHLCVLPAFGPSAKRAPPTMPSADFCAAVRSPCDDLSPNSGTQRRPPEVRPTAFAARPPDLPPRPLMAVDFAITCSLVRPGRPRYPVFVHRAAALLHASFRPRLATTPLRFANPSPPSGWIEDFHLQAVGHARHT